MGAIYDDPNREALGLAPAWEEGSGGSEGAATKTSAADARELDLDSLTKDELLELAKSLGVSPANAAMTKDELRGGVDEALAGS